jgi:ASC-1-like (ASCH) protein
MDHLAIMSKGFLNKILDGKKTIESRWTMFRRAPYERVMTGDKIFFKFSGGKIVASAVVKNTIFYQRPAQDAEIKILITKHWYDLGFDSRAEAMKFAEEKKNKKYVSVIQLEHIRRVEPFKISKKGYGSQCSWITVNKIEVLKIP